MRITVKARVQPLVYRRPAPQIGYKKSYGAIHETLQYVEFMYEQGSDSGEGDEQVGTVGFEPFSQVLFCWFLI